MPKLGFALKLSKRHCVYVDWTTEEIPRPFYVGEGTQKRVNAYAKQRRNEVHRSISLRYGIRRTIEFESDDQNECFAKERELVEQYKTYVGGGEGWWGANKDRGGQGGPSTPKSPEHKAKIQAALAGKPKSIEHRLALSIGGKGKKLTAEHRHKIRVSGKLRRHSKVQPVLATDSSAITSTSEVKQ